MGVDEKREREQEDDDSEGRQRKPEVAVLIYSPKTVSNYEQVVSCQPSFQCNRT